MAIQIRCICEALEFLVAFRSTGDTQQFSNIESALEGQIQTLLSHIQSNEPLHAYIGSLYPQIFEETYEDTKWRFVEWCTILLLLLKDRLIQASKESVVEQDTSKDYQALPCDAPSLARDSLSVQQQKTASSALQFIVALGMWPYLLPGIQGIVKSRSKFSELLFIEGQEFSPWKAHRRHVACVLSLLAVFQHPTLGALGLSHHLGDLLASLLQLCYAPIKKKPNGDTPLPSKGAIQEDERKLSLDTSVIISGYFQRCYASEGSDMELIGEMWNDRYTLSKEMDQLLSRVYQPMLIKELLILQGTPISRAKQLKNLTLSNPLPSSPSWAKKVCTQLLSEQLMRSGGVWAMIQSILEFCPDLSSESHGRSIMSTDWMKSEAVAKLVVLASPSCSLSEYYEKIGPQILSLLNGKRDSVHLVQFRIASAIIFYLTETHTLMAQEYVVSPLLKPLMNCLMETGQNKVGIDLATEQNLSQCIENLHKILTCASVPNAKFLEQLQPILHPLFSLCAACEDKITYLRELVEDILAIVLKHTDINISINLLHFFLFGSSSLGSLQKLADNVVFQLGGGGGMKAGVQMTERLPEEWLQENECQIKCVIQVLQKIDSKTFPGTFFVSLLQRMTNVLVAKDDHQPSADVAYSTLLSTEFRQQVQEKALRKNLLLLGLLQQLAEVYGDCLLEDQSQSVQFIKVTLERGAQLCHSQSADEEKELEAETLMMAMGALVMMLEKKDKFVGSDWTLLKTCLPSLDILASDHPSKWVKSMAKELTVSIRTHGIAGDCSQKTSTGPRIIHSEPQYSQEASLSKISGDDQIYTKSSQTPSHSAKAENSHSYKTGLTGINQYKEQEQKIDTSHRELSPYQNALQELQHPLLPVRGHALIVLNSLVATKDVEALQHKEKLLQVFKEHLLDSDSYIYLPSIQGLSALADLYSDEFLPVLTTEFAKLGETKAVCSTEVRLKLGEAIMKCVRNLGDMAQKYRDLLLNTFLSGTKDPDPLVRSSSLSNLGEVCKHLRFSLGLFIQEILCCLQSLMKTDTSVEVKRAAIMVLTNIFQGCGKDTLKVLEAEMLDIYRLLKNIYQNDHDDVMKLHAQLALDEIREVMTQILQSKPPLVKEIKILDLF